MQKLTTAILKQEQISCPVSAGYYPIFLCKLHCNTRLKSLRQERQDKQFRLRSNQISIGYNPNNETVNRILFVLLKHNR